MIDTRLKEIFNYRFRLVFLMIFLLEIFSLCGWLLPVFNKISFLIILILTLIVSLIKIEYGLLIVLTELFISSKGYLFSWQTPEIEVSIRIGIWLIIMSVWFAQYLISAIKNKTIKLNIFYSHYRFHLLALLLILSWGAVNALNRNEFSNIFFDLNNWFYFALILPLYTACQRNRNFLPDLLRIFFAAAAWVSIETFFLLFAFSHNLTGVIFELYRWIRDTGVGEITAIQGGFYRIFFQSHIFIVFAFFIVLSYLLEKGTELKINKIFYFGAVVTLAVFQAINLLSYSRSNWFGLVSGLSAFFLLLVFKKRWRQILDMITYLTISTAIALAIIVVVTKFPYPNPTGGFSTADLFSNRATAITGEAGASSRWSLLPELWTKIKITPIAGAGLGSTVTYITSDPRILQTNPDGEYTTYAFEWGWLDIWLKLGFFGVIAYLTLIITIIINLYKQGEYLAYALGAGLITLTAVHVFSPYLNHPLGIGAIIVLILISELDNIKIKNN